MRHIIKPGGDELQNIRRIAGESFANDDLFRELGPRDERRGLVMTYMAHYADYTVASKMLYGNDDGTGFVALLDSRKSHPIAQSRLFRRLNKDMPPGTVDALDRFATAVARPLRPYECADHLEMLMLCVDEPFRGRGLGRELVEFSQEFARKAQLPLLIDTDMPNNRDFYLHMGCELYHQTTAYNGVTRYNLVWK